MRPFIARPLALAALLPALFLFVLVPGCAKQSEGERCGDDILPNNEDCDDGLICKHKRDLLNGEAHRCCYPEPVHVSDSRCEPKGTNSTPAAGEAGANGEGS